MTSSHRMPFGAECLEDGRVRFRLWAPKARGVDVTLAAKTLPLDQVGGGWFELMTAEAAPGTPYRFRIDGQLMVPDPASRFQPEDVHGPSEVVNPASFTWSDRDWHGRPWEEAVIYELHVGTFTPEGTFAAVQQRLDYLAELGATALELMPVADFPGARNWGYDGVLPFAPDSAYGRPEDLKRLVQAAHSKGLMIFLDVVYNHFGPDGNYLHAYAPGFFTSRHCTPWGDGINFDGPGSRTVRDFFIHNALYWLEEYHFDGLRLDAVHAIADDSQTHILIELAEAVRKSITDRDIHLILENGDNAAHYLQSSGRHDPRRYDAQWNDDIHHALHVQLTGETDGYYCDYSKQPLHQLGRCLTEGFAYQGEYSEYHHGPRGEPSRDRPPTAFVSFLQNHDQIGNRALGERILTIAPQEGLKAAMAILLMAPPPPLLFMGEEFGAKTPFLFFCDFAGELGPAVTEGRRNEFARFRKFSSPEARTRIPDPNAAETFLRSKLNWNTLSNDAQAGWLQFYRALLALRQKQIVPRLKLMSGGSAEFRVLENRGLAVNWKIGDGAVLMLLANLSAELLGGLPLPGCQPLYATDAEVVSALQQGRMPPWAVAWFLRT